MSHWIPVAAVGDCPPGQSLEVVAGECIVALYNVDGEFFALDGICPHQGGPLGQSRLNGCVVTCQWHGWQFDVRDGQHQISPTLRQPSFPTKISDGQVLVQIGKSRNDD